MRPKTMRFGCIMTRVVVDALLVESLFDISFENHSHHKFSIFLGECCAIAMATAFLEPSMGVAWVSPEIAEDCFFHANDT